MKDLTLYLAIIALSGVIFLPLHIVAIRARHGDKLITTIIATIGVSAAIGVGGGWWAFGGEFSSEGAKLVACVGGGLTFLGFAGLYGLLGPSSVDRSVSVHIVKLVNLAPGRRIKEADLLKLYTHGDMLEKRFNDCIDTGIIERRGEELVVTPRGARIAFIYSAIGSILGMRLWYLDRSRNSAAPHRAPGG